MKKLKRNRSHSNGRKSLKDNEKVSNFERLLEHREHRKQAAQKKPEKPLAIENGPNTKVKKEENEQV
jgi:hypothetical protein